MKRLFLVGILSVFLLNTAICQNFGGILTAGVADANTYLEAYIAPAMQSLGVGLAGGWNATAKPHKLLGFDIGFTLNVANIPANQRTFLFQDLSWQNMQYTGGNTPLPTLVGGAGSGNLFIPANTTISNPKTGESILIENQIDIPVIDGFDLSSVPTPVIGVPVRSIQIGIGLIKNTDLKVKFFPASLLASDDFNAPKYFGIGILHDIKQWIPGMKLIPFDLSAFYGFSTFEVTQDVSVNNTSSDGSYTTTFSGEGQAILGAKASTFQIIASKKIALFTPFVSVGFNAVNSSIKVTGDYEYEVRESVSNSTETLTFTDHVNLEFTGAGGPRLSFGGRMKILVLTLQAEYTIQQYNTLTAGLGIALR